MQEEIKRQRIRLSYKDGYGYEIPLGRTKLVLIVTEDGLVGNHVIDIESLENFECPAARIGPAQGDVVESIEDLLEGEVREANLHAVQRRVDVGMPAMEALNRI